MPSRKGLSPPSWQAQASSSNARSCRSSPAVVSGAVEANDDNAEKAAVPDEFVVKAAL
uniref:Uncharacterized protein n=1 Tax=Arundo donax TaxID=35708 RepID=A0A0A9AQ88_ARUDO